MFVINRPPPATIGNLINLHKLIVANGTHFRQAGFECQADADLTSAKGKHCCLIDQGQQAIFRYAQGWPGQFGGQ